MPEKFDRETRRRTMQSVPSRDTSLELRVRRAVHQAGYRYRLRRDDLPGKPDFVLPRYRIAVFVHGCFWHGHGCKRSKAPVNNADYWQRKIARNVERDQRNQQALRNLGWTPWVIWECGLHEQTEEFITHLEHLRPPEHKS